MENPIHNSRFRPYLDSVGGLYVVLDRDGSVQFINQEGCKALGLPESEIVGQNWFDGFLPKSEAKEQKTWFHEALSEGRIVYVNDVALNIVGARQPEDLVGKPIMEFVRSDFRAVVSGRMRHMTDKPAKVPLIEETGTCSWKRPDGRENNYEYTALQTKERRDFSR